MARPRFATARELIGAFPFARYDLETQPTEQPPVEFIRSLSLSILLYSNDSIVMPVVIYELYETGAYPALSAFSVLQTIMVFAAIYGAKKIARLDSFMQLR